MLLCAKFEKEMIFFHENNCWKLSNETFNEYAQLIILEIIENTYNLQLGLQYKEAADFPLT